MSKTETAIREGRTLFPSTVADPASLNWIMASGRNNAKLGEVVQKGRLKGYCIYTLSFEERATCPKTCHHWQTCYGNNMPFAKRVDHRSPELLPKLEAEIDKALAVRGRKGILIRLHVLGDFFSVEYVQFWKRMLQKHKNLAVFGYTAHNAFSEIGFEVHQLTQLFEERAIFRHSNGNYRQLSTVPIQHADECPSDAILCPEQTGKTSSCANCGLCWTTFKNIAFMEH